MSDALMITRTEGRPLVFHLAGKLDGQTQAALLESARGAHAAGTRFLLVDLQKVELISSAGLGALHAIYKLFSPVDEIAAWEKEKHGEPYKSPYFKLAAASANVSYVLNIAGFLHNIPIYPDLESALKSFPK